MPDMGQGHTPTHRRVQKDQQKNLRRQIALVSRLVLTAHAQRVGKASNFVQFKSRPCRRAATLLGSRAPLQPTASLQRVAYRPMPTRTVHDSPVV